MIKTPITGGGGYVAPYPVTSPMPFGPEFQTKLLKVLMMDDAGDLIMEQIKPTYFDSPELRWLFAEMQVYFQKHHAMPTWMVLEQQAKSASDPKMRPTILQMIDYQKHLPVKEESWIRGQILDWVKQNLFHVAFRETKQLWDSGKRDDAMSHMIKQIDRMNEAVWRDVDRGWFFEELSAREARRINDTATRGPIPTGIKDLDDVLQGGLSPGEMGIWIAYSKGGKSTMLLNHGAMAVRTGEKRVLHFVLEGDRKQLEARYDAWMANDLYNKIKLGGMPDTQYNQLFQEYRNHPGKILIRGFTQNWAYTSADVDLELKDLKRTSGWVPDMIIVDYGDLLKGRDGPYRSDWECQRDCFRDLKSIANRGYALWTASQANYPSADGYDVREHVITVQAIAGGKEKVRAADFVGSINSTTEERAKNVARAYAELYRDNAAGKLIYLATDIARMKIGAGVAPAPDSVGKGPKPKTLGYKEKKGVKK